MSAISTTGARIDRWDNGRPAHRYHARLIETLKLERSSRYLCSEVFITFISNQHDDGADLILAPYNEPTVDCRAYDSFASKGDIYPTVKNDPLRKWGMPCLCNATMSAPDHRVKAAERGVCAISGRASEALPQRDEHKFPTAPDVRTTAENTGCQG